MRYPIFLGFILCFLFSYITSIPSRKNIRIGLVLPNKKLRLIPMLQNALHSLGVNSTMISMNLSHAKQPTSFTHDDKWDIILSHCNNLLGSEEESANNSARLELQYLESFEREFSGIPVIDSLHSQRLMANRLR
jgi:hypothetical protein